MTDCGSRFVKGGCSGWHSKFSSCMVEGLWQLSLEQGNADDEFGNTDFDGYFALFLLEQDETVALDEYDPNGAIVIIPAGNYLLRTYSSGAVDIDESGDRDEVIAATEAWSARWARWEKGCEPGSEHDRCDEHDECQLDGIPAL